MTHTPERIALRMQWLAYQSSRPVGLGVLHYTTDKTEEDIAAATDTNERGCYSDYLFGRMVKCAVHFDGGKVETSLSFDPRPDYQSWAGTYPTYQALHDAALKSLKESQ